MKLVVFFRSSKPPYNFWWSDDGHCAIRSGWCLLHLWSTCSVVWSSSPQGHVDEGTILVSCACVRWAYCGRNTVLPKPPGRVCQEGGMHPSPVWGSVLFWWWLSFPGNGCWLMVALRVVYWCEVWSAVCCVFVTSRFQSPPLDSPAMGEKEAEYISLLCQCIASQ